MNKNSKTGGVIGEVIIAVLVVVFLAAGLMVGLPIYRVWQKEMSGKAQLAEADWNRQIAIREAEAVKESANHLAQAEVIRAHGVAEANGIIAEGLGGPEGYLRYLWINNLQEVNDNGQVIYVPTEAGLPILEAGRLK